MKQLNKLFFRTRKLIAMAMGLALITLLSASSTQADDKSLVKVHFDGETKTISTEATTVNDVVERLNIDLASNDLVEPELSKVIDESVFNINVYRAQPVLIVDGEERANILTAHTSGKEIAEDAGIETHVKDKFELVRVNNFLEEGHIGLKLTVERSTPVTVNLFGEKVELNTHTETVEDALSEANIDFKVADSISPAVGSKLVKGQTITLNKENIRTVSDEEPIAFTERFINDNTLDAGKRQVETKGTNGLSTVVYEVLERNGEEISRTEINRTITKETVQQVVRIGVKQDTPAPIAVGGGSGTCSMVYNYDWPADVAYGICMAESSGNPNATNLNDIHHNCVGSFSLMQVACFWYPFFGYSSADYYNGAANMDIAYRIWQRQGGFGAWSTYTNGMYLRF